MNTPLKLTALTGAVLLLAACQSKNPNTVYCDNKPVGTEFIHSDMTYLVVDNESIRDRYNMEMLEKGTLRYCTSHVTNMSDIFIRNNQFNQPIADWDVSKVTRMDQMFYGASQFNQPIGNWNVSNVINMNSMFYKASAFNQPLGTWDVSNVTDMSFMFYEVPAFNQPIGNWDVSNVTSMRNMFSSADGGAFNQPIGDWDVSKVTRMDQMFYGATAFKQNLDNWAKKPTMPWEYE